MKTIHFKALNFGVKDKHGDTFSPQQVKIPDHPVSVNLEFDHKKPLGEVSLNHVVEGDKEWIQGVVTFDSRFDYKMLDLKPAVEGFGDIGGRGFSIEGISLVKENADPTIPTLRQCLKAREQ